MKPIIMTGQNFRNLNSRPISGKFHQYGNKVVLSAATAIKYFCIKQEP